MYTNRLIDSQDPYLLLHAHNPVEWYPWGEEALAKARRENKPIFLSVGYSTCYWCHVAERTIYSDPAIAKLMNDWFVNVKVDREERPDLDAVYMLATQLLTGHGGWPNNVFMTPDLKPFYAGSYFPPEDDAYGRPGFVTVLKTLHQIWSDSPQRVLDIADKLYQAMQQVQNVAAIRTAPIAVQPANWLKTAEDDARRNFDAQRGGLLDGGDTKFPHEPMLDALLSAYERRHDAVTLEIVTTTLDAMAYGGIHDQLAGGFHRYSTESSWSVPHFEKMLYDNAQLLALYARAYALTQRPLYRYVADRTAHYLTSQMMAPDGGFYTAQDAEVDGEEGASYLWTQAQIESLLGAADATRFFDLYELVPAPAPHGGPSPGNVLRLRLDRAQALDREDKLVAELERLAPLRDKLLAARDRRKRPLRDDKLIVGLNALAIEAFAQAGRWLGEPADLAVAQRAAGRIWALAYDGKSGTLKHQVFHGQPKMDGYLDDYALLGETFLTLHEATHAAAWRQRAQRLADAIIERFQQPDGRLATTPAASELLIAPQDDGDQTQPSGSSAAIGLWLALGAQPDGARYAQAADGALAAVAQQVEANPLYWGSLLARLDQHYAKAQVALPQAASLTLPSSANYVQASGRLDDGGKRLIVSLRIADGYHVNANPASDKNLVPTQLLLDGVPAADAVYPKSVRFKPPFAPAGIEVYERSIVLSAPLPDPQKPPKPSMRVQACNDQFCLAPAEIPVSVK